VRNEFFDYSNEGVKNEGVHEEHKKIPRGRGESLQGNFFLLLPIVYHSRVEKRVSKLP